jgi:hypothetical protein
MQVQYVLSTVGKIGQRPLGEYRQIGGKDTKYKRNKLLKCFSVVSWLRLESTGGSCEGDNGS